MRVAYKLMDGKWEETDDTKAADVIHNDDMWTLRNPSVMPDLFFKATTRKEFNDSVRAYDEKYTPCPMFHRAIELM